MPNALAIVNFGFEILLSETHLDLQKTAISPQVSWRPNGSPFAFASGMHKTSLRDRALQFGVCALRLYQPVSKLGPQYAKVALQLVEAGTSIGAQLEEGDVALSRRDMAAKHVIALREAKESRYWLRLLSLDGVQVTNLRWMLDESNELVAMLTTSVKKLRDPLIE